MSTKQIRGRIPPTRKRRFADQGHRRPTGPPAVVLAAIDDRRSS